MTDRLSPPRPGHRLEQFVGPVLILASLGLYAFTLAPTVLEADAGEFQFVPWLPGIAHPTGYPLYTLLGWVWSHFFSLGEVAWRLNLLSALLAAVVVGFTYYLARQLLTATLPKTLPLGQIVTAAGVAFFFALTPTFWSQALVAEVYSLHALFVSVILWLALRWRREQCDLRSATAKLLSVTIGLGLTHHRTTVLLLPGLAMVWWLHYCQTDRPRYSLRTWATHGLLLGLPLLLYLYLPVIAHRTPYATLSLSDTQTLTVYDNSWRGFWQHVWASVFTGALQPATAGWERLILTWQLMRQEVGLTGVILGLTGLTIMWQAKQIDLLLLTILSWVAFVTFNLIYFIGDLFVLFIPAWLILSLWIGLGVLGSAHWLATDFVRRRTSYHQPPIFEGFNRLLRRRIYAMLLVALVVIFFMGLIGSLIIRNGFVSQRHNDVAAIRWQTILTEPLPDEAVLLSNDRNEIMPLWYYQYVEGRRPDLLGLFPLIVADPAYATVGGVLEQALASGRPVYFIKSMEGLSLKADLSSAGTLFRASPINGEQPDHLTNLKLPEVVLDTDNGNARETIRLVGYSISSKAVGPGDALTVTLYWQPIQPLAVDYTSYVHLISADAQGITQSDHRPGGEVYPSRHWRVGEQLRDRHTLLVPADAPSGDYRLRVGMYYQSKSGEIRGMGPGEEMGRVIVR